MTAYHSQVKPDIAAYNALLRGYRMCAFTDKFEETFQKMKAEGVEPDVVSHTERIIVWGKSKNIGEMIKKLQDMKVGSNLLSLLGIGKDT